MKIFDMIVLCLGNLRRHKIRTVLTSIGMVLGTGIIIVTISLNLGMTRQQEEQLAQMGDLTKIDIYNYGGGGGAEQKVLDDKALKEIQALDGVEVVTPFKEEYSALEIWYGDKYQYSNSIVGVYPDALEKLGFELVEGGYLTDGTGKKIPVLFGEKAAYQFANVKRQWSRVYPYPDANGNIPDPYVDPMKDDLVIRLRRNDEEKMKLIEYPLRVDGVLVGDYTKDYRTQYGVFMDIEDMDRLVKEYQRLNKIKEDPNRSKGYDNAVVKCKDIDSVEAVEAYISDTMGFDTSSMEDIRKPIQEQIRSTTLVLGIFAAVSVIVAAISIANTMYMSISERTQEIGIMKVLGCEVPNIRAMFLIESGAIGLIGGIVGAVVSMVASWIINHLDMIKAVLGIQENGGGYYGGGILGGGMLGGGGDISLVPPWLVVVALLFGVAIGLFSGFIPSNRAVKVSALEAIKSN